MSRLQWKHEVQREIGVIVILIPPPPVKDIYRGEKVSMFEIILRQESRRRQLLKILARKLYPPNN